MSNLDNQKWRLKSLWTSLRNYYENELSKSNFKFDDEGYRQIRGVAIASQLALILDDISLGKIENITVVQHIDNFLFYSRYRDDTFTLCKEHTNRMEIFKRLNDVHLSIKFTCEDGNEGQIVFLNV